MFRSIVLAGFVCVTSFGCDPVSVPRQTPPTLQSPAAVASSESPPETASKELQAKRLALMQKYIKLGVVHKITTPGTVANLYVTRDFLDLSIDDKQLICGVFAAWAYAVPQGGNMKDDDLLRLFDSRSGKKIGECNARGLKMY